MVNQKVKYWNDVILLISFVIAAITGVLLYFFIPSGPGQGLRGAAVFLGVTKATWRTWHNIPGLIMFVTAALHVIFNWKIFTAMTKNQFRKK